MKKKSLLLLLFPILLTSCGNSGVSFDAFKARIDTISRKEEYPFYRVIGSLDFNGMITNVDATFDKNPVDPETFTPYSRYTEGFYNSTIDTAENKVENIMIYGMSSKSYWLRAPLRINNENFYGTVADNVGKGSLNGVNFDANYETGMIGAIGPTITEATFSLIDNNNLKLIYKENENPVDKTFIRVGSYDGKSLAKYNGKWTCGNDVLIFNQSERENRTCANALMKNIITSYAGQSGSINPSKNVMTYELLSDGGFAFVGNKVHTYVKLDNYPFYPDPSAHPQIGEWDEDDPLPCYKNIINVKANIRFEYNANGYLVKEYLQSLEYDANNSSPAQVSLIAIYNYKFE